ncbi:hypothetical protein BDN72DRAFT_794118 [Pluteus cervinus]|uniref:Uncharacterized protein n=1 Tax=Pluteus cervinus TaxID=181527 RepID=A0ACD3AZX0_9AGAR|nr:hypothetical protein BDN72DRAFT_794118 [Pluteus cervinus]
MQNYDSSTTVPEGFRGLGFVSSHQDIVEITFDLPASISEVQSEPRHGKRKARKKTPRGGDSKELVIHLAQDKTALRSRKGDTGSVVWRASIDFARLVLEQLHSQHPEPLFHADRLREAHILELGAGTGLLSIALSAHVKNYTVTDLDTLIPLIKKNIFLNAPGSQISGHNITVSSLDWVALHKAPEHIRQKSFQTCDIDCLLVVDCIYHPSLIEPLVETMDYLSTPGKTVALIVMELRAEDVTRNFLLRLLEQPRWKVYRLPFMDLPYVVWGGYKV